MSRMTINHRWSSFYLMDEDFEGSLVLEKLAFIGEKDNFFKAIDNDDFAKAASLMRRAGVDNETIQIVLRKMEEADGSH